MREKLKIETAKSYLEKTTGSLEAVLTEKDQCLEIIAGGMDRYHALCNQETSIRMRIDHQLDEYYPLMEANLDGIGTE